MSDPSKAVRVRVTGRVQGVNYRAWTRAEAKRLGLAGWVRNEPDGSVSALIAGPASQVDALLDAMRRGPPAAAVDDLVSGPAALPDNPAGFRITG